MCTYFTRNFLLQTIVQGLLSWSRWFWRSLPLKLLRRQSPETVTGRSHKTNYLWSIVERNKLPKKVIMLHHKFVLASTWLWKHICSVVLLPCISLCIWMKFSNLQNATEYNEENDLEACLLHYKLLNHSKNSYETTSGTGQVVNVPYPH